MPPTSQSGLKAPQRTEAEARAAREKDRLARLCYMVSSAHGCSSLVPSELTGRARSVSVAIARRLMPAVTPETGGSP